LATTETPIFTFRISGETLKPAEITSLLGLEPTRSFSKGDRNIGAGGREYAQRRTGMWLLEANEHAHDTEACVLGLLATLPEEPQIWRSLAAKFELNLTVGLFMYKTNEGFSLSPRVLEALGYRGISIDFDIYAPTTPDQDDACPCGSGKIYGSCCIATNL